MSMSGSESVANESDNLSVLSVPSHASRAPGPHAVPIVWRGLRNTEQNEPSGSIRFNAESVYSYTAASMGSINGNPSDSVSQR